MLPKRRKPTHPGKILLEECLNPLGISPKQFAEKLGRDWTEIRVQALIQGKENVSEKTAQELAEQLGTTTQLWLHLQNRYNLAEETDRQNEKGSLKPWKKAQ